MLSRLPTTSLIAVVLAAVFGRMSTALAQIVAGIYLSPSDFGIYATATGIMLITTVFRAGGSAHFYQTMTLEEFRENGGRVFRYSLAVIALGIAISLGATLLTAPWFAETNRYPPQTLTQTMGVLVVNYVLFNTACYPRFHMVAEGRFRELSLMETSLGAARLTATFTLAALGYGPVALAGATTAAQALENLWAWSRSHMTWRDAFAAPGGMRWTSLIGEVKFPLVLAVLANLNMQIETLIGSTFLPVAVVGFYFFASQLANQPAMLMSSSLRSVFTSAAATVRGRIAEEREAIRTVFNGAMVFIPLMMMSIPAVFEPIERALWQGKWADSRWPLMILSITMVFPTALQLMSAPIAGLRDWRLAIRIDILRCVPKTVAAAIAGGLVIWLGTEPVNAGILLSALVGGVASLVAMVELHRILHKAGASNASIVYELWSTPTAAVLSAVAASGLAHSMVEPLTPSLNPRVGAALECMVAALIYATLSLLLLRFGYTPTLERLLQAVPGPIAAPLRRALRMPAP